MGLKEKEGEEQYDKCLYMFSINYANGNEKEQGQGMEG